MIFFTKNCHRDNLILKVKIREKFFFFFFTFEDFKENMLTK